MMSCLSSSSTCKHTVDDDKQLIIRDSLVTAERYARTILNVELHEWQARVLYDCSVPLGRRRRVAVRAPNGAGKDDRIIAPLALWWLQRYKRGQVQITTKDEKQLTNQTWRSISTHRHLYPNYPTWRDHDHTIATPSGGLLSGWVTDDPRRAEGYHEEEPDGPLLIIINEAKSVDDSIFDSFGRCSYNLILAISTGGLMEHRFYEIFTHKRTGWSHHIASLKDCPHIPNEKVQQTIQDFGENDPYTRSNIYGEFMATDDTIKHVFELPDVESNRAADIPALGGPTVAGVDFAAGGDLNTLVKRVGNFCPKDGIYGWRDKDTSAAKWEFVRLFNHLGLEARSIWADADGLGLPICCELDANGWRVNRFHGGVKPSYDRYKNLWSQIWYEVSAKVKNDYADAFCIAFGVNPIRSTSYIEQEDRFAEISRLNGWDYTPDQEEVEAGRPGRGDIGFGGGNGFGGVNCDM